MRRRHLVAFLIAGAVDGSARDASAAALTTTDLRLSSPAAAGLRGGAPDAANPLKIEHRAFVANLPRTLTNEGLRSAFEEFGKVKEARVSCVCDGLRAAAFARRPRLRCKPGEPEGCAGL